VKLLESRIGVLLFRRDHRGVQLTPAGQRFLAEASIGAQHFTNALNAMRSIRRGEGGELRIGLFTTLASGFARELFLQYRRRHGNVDIHFEESATQSSIAAVLDGRLDLALVTGEPVLSMCETLKLWNERLFLALPESHQLVGQALIDVAALRDQKFIATAGGRGPEIEDYLVARLSKPGSRLHIQTYSVSRETLISMVGLGFGLAVITESGIAAKYEHVVFRQLQLDPDSIPASAIWLSANANPALKPLIRLARSMSEGFAAVEV
jgi:DNA-binding transcriptional LysR family regulator